MMTSRIPKGAVALLLLVLASASMWWAEAAELYPQCDSPEHKISASVGSSTTLPIAATPGTRFTISCFAHEVTPSTGGQKDPSVDYCRVAHQTEYPYHLLVRATYEDKNGNRRTRDFDIRDLAGGSIDGVTLTMDRKSTFSVVFTNKAVDSRCTMSLRALLSYTVSGDDEEATRDTPTIVALRPATIYASNDPSTIVLQFPEDAAQSMQDQVMLLPLKETCAAPRSPMMMDPATTPQGVAPAQAGTVYTARSRQIHTAGRYRVCYKPANKDAATELAIVTAYASNPAFYTIVAGLGPSGEVYTDQPLTIKFVGSSLDTRPGGDSAKLIDEDSDCETGRPAGGVPIGTDLGPEDNYGPNTTYSLWGVTIRYGGVYVMCYKRAQTRTWTVVPYITAVDPGNGANQETTGAPVPIPTSPSSGDTCPMAPAPGPGESWVKYETVRMVMKRSLPAQEILSTILKLFCVPRSAVVMTRLTHNADHEQLVYFSFLCDNVTNAAGQLMCDTRERSNYADYLGTSRSPLLEDYQIKNISGSTSMAIAGDDPMSGGGSSVLSTVIVCGTLLAVVAMLATAVSRYREKRQYMVQFGMDDGDDIDDMYATGVMPATGASGEGGIARQGYGPMMSRHDTGAGAAPVRDAMIEIED